MSSDEKKAAQAFIARSDYYYDLPEELIAQTAIPERDQSRLLYLAGDEPIRHLKFSDLPELLRAGDLLVFNNSKVIPARLHGQKVGGGPVELLLLRQENETEWRVIGRPGKRLKPGAEISFIPNRLSAVVKEILPGGERIVSFKFEGIWAELLAEAGEMPLPPYIHEKLSDPERYNTVYAKVDGSAAAPTAGLHFTPQLLNQLKERGVESCELCLHVGLGTFRPVKEDNILEHKMHSEYYSLSEAAAAQINLAKAEGRRVIAVGTTSCRVLETIAAKYSELRADCGESELFIYPPYDFKLLDGLITNFHLPESTLLLLVSALMGKEKVLAAYQEAIKEGYRFFSFGDACFFLPEAKKPDKAED
ncbi:MAG: tRNA preQ1(34) S-adenosylmethionine ribosyltransferase-isomerase QueA [Eubacteriales bacterium]|nr:tRNA preQ1(34) S-adenosylmethionine ribosyltransferase-isomerase QueA [Eubacteriales bacterium]